MALQFYQKDFIKFLVLSQALQFGSFKLKSGRIAPYFLNMGKFYTGRYLFELGNCYAQAYLNSGWNADVIFGPAYKGIPLSVITTSALYKEHGKDLSYAFNRKEAKNYGDANGSPLVGAPLTETTRVLLIDDVITAGTAICETIELLKHNGNPQIIGILIAVNRMEKNNDEENALEAIEKEYGLKVFSIVNLDDIIEALYNSVSIKKIKSTSGLIIPNIDTSITERQMEEIRAYRAQYGV